MRATQSKDPESSILTKGIPTLFNHRAKKRQNVTRLGLHLGNPLHTFQPSPSTGTIARNQKPWNSTIAGPEHLLQHQLPGLPHEVLPKTPVRRITHQTKPSPLINPMRSNQNALR